MKPINKWMPFEFLYDLALEIYYQFQDGYVYTWIFSNGKWTAHYLKITPENQIKHKDSLWNVKTITYYNRYPVLFCRVGYPDTDIFVENKTGTDDKIQYQKQDSSDIRAMVESVMHGDMEFYLIILAAAGAVISALYLSGMMKIPSVEQLRQATEIIINQTSRIR